jgi:hypothetical protein
MDYYLLLCFDATEKDVRITKNHQLIISFLAVFSVKKDFKIRTE